jgi:hypothetical protein
MAVLALPSEIKTTGIDQNSLVTLLTNFVTVINELVDDHATFKTVVDDLKTLANLNQHRSQNFILSQSPVLAIDTNFDVKNTETTVFVAGGVVYTLTDNTSCDTGTTKTITASQWGAFAVEATNATTLSANWASGSYASEALALAAAKALTPTANKCTLGFVTINAHGSGFTAGTDALTTGTGGNVATATNYYSMAVPNFTAVSSSSPATLTNSTDLTLSRG